jgi:hypothetical protein
MGLHRLRHSRKKHYHQLIKQPHIHKEIQPIQDMKWIEVMDAEERYEKHLDKITTTTR